MAIFKGLLLGVIHDLDDFGDPHFIRKAPNSAI